ncbi:MAG: thymidylate synthase [Wendovervirus sonii]|uniref:Thymidylate synthase n=1 Tax=phage Lak_Megaphage_Sonny TaxID=3109229 RepID=A0ABZ0Z6N6_9CAUD|nr:MAG: thymidylate synthase [phage Lak_Megaphage_Sonny]
MITNLIVAIDKKTNGIGVKGTIPWKIKDDMKWFKKMTINNAVIMGRKTYESLQKPLIDRLNIVISKTLNKDGEYPDNVRIACSVEDAIGIAEKEHYGMAFIIGGASVYKESMDKDLINGSFYIDYINNDVEYDYDAFFPKELPLKLSDYRDITPKGMDPRCHCVALHRFSKSPVLFNVLTHDSKYLNMLKDIYNNGITKHTRAGETLSIFPYYLTFNLQKGLPILNTKKVFAKGCIHELLWFLKGGTNIKYLVDNNVHIWDDDAYRYYTELVNSGRVLNKLAFLNKDAFLEFVKREETLTLSDGKTNEIKTYHFGDLGPVYGKQWTDWNGINQIDELIEKLKNNPDDRRLIVSSWNVGEIKDMALPPCHYMSQWYTTELFFNERLSIYFKTAGDEAKASDDENYMSKVMDEMNIPKYRLSCMWSQRSVDTCLGFPYDLLSYSILVHMVAQVTNMIPDKLHCILGDTHIYKNQLDDAYLQMVRNPYLFDYPTLELNKDITNIYDFKYDDIKIVDYQSYPAIKYKLSVGL